MIFESIITTTNPQGLPHVAPFGVRYENGLVVISPFRPSTTLENILSSQFAVLNIVDDVRVFAGALTGRQPWQLDGVAPRVHLAGALSHAELVLVEVRDDVTRPQLLMRKTSEQVHRAFQGFNRAQAAVIELAVLASRLHMLPKEKVSTEMQYLQIAMDKTAGEVEQEAWGWLVEKIDNYYAELSGDNQA